MVGSAAGPQIDFEMSAQYTYQQIANNYFLWQEYAESDLELSEVEFDRLSEAQKVKLQILAFGPETDLEPKAITQ
ncbi:MAG: hypothetical protein IPG42_03905 [Betaproteobacteria bacterium]|jgi:hypothetical protein|nr:hypothetical protein [Betaproteobacteria bacterium]MBK7656976.1 hypothetical protein [Betaproteobacteria bacterium]